MLKKELIKLIETIGDEGSIDEVLSTNILTLDAFKEKAKGDSIFKSFLDSEKDKHSTKSLETWKTNNLEKLINDEIRKRYPEKDEKDIKIEAMMAEIEKFKKESLMKEIKNQAILMLDEKKLPKELLDFIVSDDLEKTKGNIENLTKVFNPFIQSAVEERLKTNSYTPPSGGDTTKNPWSKEHFNLTEQGKLLKENPTLASQYMAQAHQ